MSENQIKQQSVEHDALNQERGLQGTALRHRSSHEIPCCQLGRALHQKVTVIQQPATWIGGEEDQSLDIFIPLFHGFTSCSLLGSLPGAGDTQHRALEMSGTWILHLSPSGSGVEEMPSASYYETSGMTKLKLATWWA